MNVMRNRIQPHKLGRDKRAISPAISTVILTSAVVMLVLVAVVFANNFLNSRIAQNEFSATTQFMQTVGLQIDDVAWTVGRTQTLRYSSSFGQVYFQSLALNYTVYVNNGTGYVYLANYSSGVLLFNMPISSYNVGNNYYQNIFPSDNSFLDQGTSAPVSHVFVTEKLPMNDGNFIRVVVAPTIRTLNSTISTATQTTNYFNFYLPILSTGISPGYSQSVTLASKSVSVMSQGGVNSVKIVVSFPKTTLGFDAGFFNFGSVTNVLNVPNGSIVEFYTGEVNVSLGLYA
jgi:type II secretory pathway pseudopilin PulG